MGEAWQAVDAWSLVARVSDVSGHDVEELLLRADDDTLTRTDRAQISTFALEIVIHAFFAEHDERADGVAAAAGHSLGEYAALTAAGILDLDAATRLVTARGAAMLAAAEAEPGTMVAVMGAPPDAVASALAPLVDENARVWIANFNAPEQIVVAGDGPGIEAASAALGTVGKVVRLPVGGAFHSPMMASASDALRVALDRASFGPGAYPVVANVDAELHDGGPGWAVLLERQLTAPVRWSDSVQTLVGVGHCEQLVEIGPGNTLTNLVKRIAKGTPASRVTPPEIGA